MNDATYAFTDIAHVVRQHFIDQLFESQDEDREPLYGRKIKPAVTSDISNFDMEMCRWVKLAIQVRLFVGIINRSKKRPYI